VRCALGPSDNGCPRDSSGVRIPIRLAHVATRCRDDDERGRRSRRRGDGRSPQGLRRAVDPPPCSPGSSTPMPSVCVLFVESEPTMPARPSLGQAIESSRTWLPSGRRRSENDGAFAGVRPMCAIDGTYARRWAVSPGKSACRFASTSTSRSHRRVRLVLASTLRTTPGLAGVLGTRSRGPDPLHEEASEDGRPSASWQASRSVRTGLLSLPLRTSGSITPACPDPCTWLACASCDGRPRARAALPRTLGGAVVSENAAYRADEGRRS